MSSEEAIALKAEIDKLKFHNRTLLNLIGAMGKGDHQPLTVFEAIVVHDLSKEQFRAFTQLVREFDGDFKAFERRAGEITPTFSRNAAVGMLKALVASQMLRPQAQKILDSIQVTY